MIQIPETQYDAIRGVLNAAGSFVDKIESGPGIQDSGTFEIHYDEYVFLKRAIETWKQTIETARRKDR